MAKKSTKAEFNQRLTEVQNLLLSGFTRSQIVHYGSKWKVVDRQIDEYISQATAIIKEHNSATIQDNMAIITSNLWDQFRQAKQEKNISECHKILMSLAKLKGLDQMTVNHIIEDKRELADLSDEDLERMLETNESTSH